MGKGGRGGGKVEGGRGNVGNFDCKERMGLQGEGGLLYFGGFLVRLLAVCLGGVRLSAICWGLSKVACCMFGWSKVVCYMLGVE